MAARVTNDVVVYRATNLVNGKCYIGVTRRGLGRREHEHRYNARRGVDSTLYRALRKYGDEAFKFETVFDFQGDYDLAMVFEAELVDAENPAYNLVPGGLNRTGPIAPETLAKMRAAHVGKPNARKGTKMPEGYVSPRTGTKHTEETRAKMKAAKAGEKRPWVSERVVSDETRAKMREAHLGKPGPWAGKKRPEAAVWFSKANKGRPAWNKGVPMGEETKLKVSAAKMGRVYEKTPARQAAIDANYAKMIASRKKPVRCLNDGRVFERVADVPGAYGVSLSSVLRVLKNRYPSVKGWRFEYAEV